MKLKLDENLPVEAAVLMNKAGHDAHTVLQEELGGQPDFMISAVCRSEERILITLDTDFCNILNYPPQDQSKSSVLGFIEQIITAIEKEQVSQKLWIVQKDGIRIR